MQLTLKCFECKESFLKTSMIQIFSATGKTSNWYCPKCAEEKMARNAFSDRVCQIFGIKSPGPRIWTERKRLRDTYGYTDDTIIKCLNYIYEVKKMKKLTESLALITPSMVEEMIAYNEREERRNQNIIAAMNMQTREYVVPVQKRKPKKKEKMNPDDYLFDD